MKEIDKKVIQKWSPIIESLFDNMIKNNYLMYHICNFCEWYSISNIEASMSPHLNLIKENIQNFARVSIVGEFFNPATCIQEYKLSNGKYVPTKKDGYIDYELSRDELLKIFKLDYIKYALPVEFRDDQINKVL